jgi:2-hydroxychromene-2-carboxylate isomerase
MRCCCALEQDPEALLRFSLAAFRSYFAHGDNIDEPAVLIEIASQCGLAGETLLERASTQPVKDQLRANTEEAISRGAYGSPTIFINDKLYFGNDQLPLVRQALLDESEAY